jgi:transposase
MTPEHDTYRDIYMNEQLALFDAPEPILSKDDEQTYQGKPRINYPIRNQVEIMTCCIENIIPADHKVRFVWEFVQNFNMSGFIDKIKSVAGTAGRSATDPHLLLALWVYATIEGIGSGRVIERYCTEHNAFKWLCGNINVNHHSLTDFRSENKELLDDLLTQSVEVFLHQGIIDLERIAQDGIRVRAHAGTSSFRRKETLEDHHLLAKEYVKQLIEEQDADPKAAINHKKARELRLAKQKETNLKEALEHLKKLQKEKQENKKGLSQKIVKEKIKKVRASSTDPQARIMKMANSGFSPAHNAQLATDTKTQVIVGVSVTNSGVDIGQMSAMHEQVQKRFARWGIKIKSWLVDGGYNSGLEIERMNKNDPNCTVYMPPKNSQLPESYLPKKTDSEIVKEWRMNMGTIEAKTIYKERAATAECANANARNRGLLQFAIRGLEKVTASMLIFALTHNIVRAMSLLN